MNCMKCGREMPLGQVFCKDCLADMANYPVKPGTPVVLPPSPEVNAARRGNTRKVRKPEEQLSRLRRWMVVMLIVFMIIITAGTMLIISLSQKIDTLEQANASIAQELE